MTNATVLVKIRVDRLETFSIMRGITDQLLAITSVHHKRHEAGFLRYSVGLIPMLCKKKLLVFVSTMSVNAICFMAISTEECKVPKQRPHYSPALVSHPRVAIQFYATQSSISTDGINIRPIGSLPTNTTRNDEPATGTNKLCLNCHCQAHGHLRPTSPSLPTTCANFPQCIILTFTRLKDHDLTRIYSKPPRPARNSRTECLAQKSLCQPTEALAARFATDWPGYRISRIEIFPSMCNADNDNGRRGVAAPASRDVISMMYGRYS